MDESPTLEKFGEILEGRRKKGKERETEEERGKRGNGEEKKGKCKMGGGKLKMEGLNI